ncbi:probable F-box protein At4g22030 [Lotus japonicus]|uniref:probable F-box protein At4g22030 n=1 Tax=Lotus japonicus TaxID=34305 RepID=UPI00258F2194|nr:probable F-box protein At4g22030 [Lotus japonicus]
MASLQITSILSSSSSCPCSLRKVNASIHVPKPHQVFSSFSKIPTRKLQIEEINGFTETTTPLELKNAVSTQIYDTFYSPKKSKAITLQLYAILEAVADRVEMHNNVREQRQNWNTLLLKSINMITLTATTMCGVAAAHGGDGESSLLAMKLSSTLLFSAATGLLLIMNKIQPSQLAEEQRCATRLFKQLQSEIETKIAFGNPTEEDVKGSMEKVLALDKAYPLPLLGAMLEKFPKKLEPSVWWPATLFQWKSKTEQGKMQGKKTEYNRVNGWSEELEMEMREVIEVVKRKDAEDYDRLGNIALKVHKSLAIAGPLLTGIAALGSSFVGNGPMAAIVPVMAGSLASVINAFEHGGQVGMVFEMYRNCGGFFKLLEETIEATLEEKDLEKRENGEIFEMKVAMKLGRSVSELRQLASKSGACSMEGIGIDEFASKLF